MAKRLGSDSFVSPDPRALFRHSLPGQGTVQCCCATCATQEAPRARRLHRQEHQLGGRKASTEKVPENTWRTHTKRHVRFFRSKPAACLRSFRRATLAHLRLLAESLGGAVEAEGHLTEGLVLPALPRELQEPLRNRLGVIIFSTPLQQYSSTVQQCSSTRYMETRNGARRVRAVRRGRGRGNMRQKTTGERAVEEHQHRQLKTPQAPREMLASGPRRATP